MRGGKHSKLRSPFFPLALPLSGHAFSTTFPVNHLLPPDHKETQPFHPAVQRSADSSSNPRGPTQPHPNPTSQATTLTYRPNPTSQAATLTYRSNPTFRAATLTYRPNPISRAATLTYRPEKPAREACAACRRTLQEGSRFLAGGNLRCFSKVRCLSEASSDFWKTLLADSRQPRSQPLTKPRRQAAHASRAGFSGWGVMVEGWVAAREIGFRMIGGVGSRRLDEPSALRWTARWKG